ncbi:hypothetical protein [Arthrobacter caoxuetaonis]|uniref:Uncharacterized protein n=1 Tax=Arthrobacter caoxuetaonis TaxID=2886935 RepID=A0A9X1MFT3_9MICC|nr:hypothetical protein [Arthrobacter caoxuetaonis]MCC3299289.1 hypothetical protein [Arthrobacter caoxuetaonis]USQ59217.1 hypothetical protein NF551_16675 [Arthrobacter caoxuetaonis]
MSEPSSVPAKPRRVPKFDELDEEKGMNRLQKSFYNRVFLPSFLAGNPVDVNGQTGYAEVLMRSLVEERDADPAAARRTLTALIDAYPYAKDGGPFRASDTMATFCFLDGDFAAGYDALRIGVTASLHLTLAEHLGHPPLKAMQVLQWSEWGITRKGIHDLDNVVDALQARLDEFQAERGVSIVTDFWRRLTADKPVDEVAADIEDEVQQVYTADDIRWFLEQDRAAPPRTYEYPSRWDPDGTVPWPGPWIESTRHYGLFRAWLRFLTRQAENDARDHAGVPRVGEQWRSEMHLLGQLREAMPQEKFVHQYRPYWLAPQSLDIFLPAYDIAVEYQGLQHTRPVEFFGGKKTFEDQEVRDIVKAMTCAENGCTLIEVHPGYVLEDVVRDILAAIEQHNSTVSGAHG